MQRVFIFLLLVTMITVSSTSNSFANASMVTLGNEVLMSKFHHLIEGKKVGLVTNQTGVNSKGTSLIDILAADRTVQLTALYGPEHGIDGRASAGDYVSSYTHPVLKIPVYSLYGKTRMPTEDMLKNIDVLLFDIQDIGARSYTYMSTLNYSMVAAQKYKKPIVVLDRPNPIGGTIVEGPVLKDPYLSFVGIDNLPMAHGMTAGELALFFNRKIGADLSVIPMEGYTRSMVYPDTGLTWIPSSPRIPDIDSVFGYMATGLGEGTGIFQGDHFKWIGGKGIDSQMFANLLNGANLPGVTFTPETRGTVGGVRLTITDYHTFNPAKTGIYALGFAHSLNRFAVPKSTPHNIIMFDKIMGTNQIGADLEKGLSPQQIEFQYAAELAQFKQLREKYLIYGEQPEFNAKVIKSNPAPVIPTVTPVTAKPAAIPIGQPAVPTTSKPQTKPAQPAAKPSQPIIQPKVPAKATAKPAEKIAYLTFDDGPSVVTLKILDILKANKIKATFFMVGRNVKGNEAVVKRVVAEGHALGGHTYSHDYRSLYRSPAAFFKDLEYGNKLIEQAAGVKPAVFRYPGGSTNTVSKKMQDPKLYGKNKWVMEDIRKEAKKRGYHFIDWNVSSGDAKSAHYSVATSVKLVTEGARNKREIVVLMHDTTAKMNTAIALPAIIKNLKAQGFTFRMLGRESLSVSYVK